ncbi:MAG: exodeoxyribonuclease VII small subunit [bacterium]|nr:exodeoxyribonuclease VII small subunit [bacterium]
MEDSSQPASYAAAVEELDDILAAIERDEVDVDVLSQKVGRAVTLVQYCRERIAAAEVEVERVVAELTIDDEADV